jgi:hypothetical protein
MSFNFPNNPDLNDTYVFNNKTYRFNGSAWVVLKTPLTSSNIEEGTNLFFTESRAREAFVPGPGVQIQSNGFISVSSVGLDGYIQYSDGGFFSSNASLSFSKETGTLTTKSFITTQPINYSIRTITSNTLITSEFNAFSSGPVIIGDSVTVEIEDGADWTIV